MQVTLPAQIQAKGKLTSPLGGGRIIAHLGQGGFLSGSDGKESACNAGDSGSIPGLGRSLGEGNGCPHQYSFLGNPMDRGAWRNTVHGVAESQI